MREIQALFVYPALVVGGAERQLVHLVGALHTRGFLSTVMTLKGKGQFFDELCARRFPVFYAGMRSRWDVAGMVRALRLARRASPDIVVTHGTDAQVVGHVVARLLGVPHLTVEHGGPGLRRALHRRILLRLLAPHVDSIVAVADAQVAMLEQFGFRADGIIVIPNGTLRPIPARDRASVRAELGIDATEVAVLMAATLRVEKRSRLFVEAIAHARRTLPTIRGVIAGGGPEFEVTSRRAAELGGTVVLGERNDVPDLIGASDIVCLTSTAEGHPMIVLEAMALGRPVVATAVGGLPSVVTADTGLLVKDASSSSIGDAIVALARRPDLRLRMGRSAEASYLHRYTVDRMADRYAALIRKMVATNDTRRRGRYGQATHGEVKRVGADGTTT